MRKIRAYEQGEFPEWVGDRDGIRHLLDGVRFQHTCNEEARRQGDQVPTLEGLNPDEWKGLTEEQIYAELVSGCIVAYFAAMSQVLDHRTFARIISPLADAIAQALAQSGIITEVPPDRWEPLITEMKQKASEKAEQDERLEAESKMAQAESLDDDVLKRAIEGLKNAGRRLTH